MKLKDIESALGIGILFDEDDCSLIESKYYEDLMNHLEYLIYFNRIQSEQYAKVMRKRNYTLSFINEGGAMRFYELYKIKEETTVRDAVKRNLFPWQEYKQKVEKDFDKDSEQPYFILEKIKTPGNLERRLIVELLKNLRMSVTSNVYPNLEVIAIEKQKVATEFLSYSEVFLSYNELRQVVKDDKWRDMLSRFGGIYLVHDKYTGKNYIGSASGRKGILQRWLNYAENPTGGNDEKGNKKLVELLNKGMHGNDTSLRGKDYAEKYFVYSILEVMSIPKGKDDYKITKAESRWKRNLGTIEFGLNAN